MFSHLADFGYQRSKKQALGLYITYALGLLVLGGFVGFWAAIVQQVVARSGVDYQQIQYLGEVVAGLGSAALTYAIVAKKNLKASYLLVVLLAGIAGSLAGVFVGVIFAAVVSTKAPAARVDAMQMSEALR
jgi:mannose/fructose/N-acetylgalactosamine-specific phosphotransferase system component IID